LGKIKFHLAIPLVLVFLIPCVFPGAARCAHDLFDLTVAHTGDVHSKLMQINKDGDFCRQEEAARGECLGGAARLASALEKARAEAGRFILVDSGDQFQGSLFFTLLGGEPMAFIMNEMGYSAMSLGNHEFDDGPEVLADFLKKLTFPALACNLEFSGPNHLSGLVRPHTVMRMGGRKIGLIGVVTEETAYTSSPGPGVLFKDPAASVEKAVAELKAQDVGIIIILSHIGLERDKRLAAAVPGIDVIVSGHSHDLLSNTEKDAAGPYPLVVQNAAGPCLIVAAGQWGEHVGILKASFDAKGRAVEWSGNALLLDQSVPRDPVVLAKVEAFDQDLEKYRNTLIGKTLVDLDGSRETCRARECSLGSLAADAILKAASGLGAEIGLLNGGGVRASIPKGVVSLDQIMNAFPFHNEILVVKLRGADLVEMLEQGVREIGPGKDLAGGFPQVAGLRFEWDPARPPGSHILRVEVGDSGRFAPIDPARDYRVAVSDYLVSGGDGYCVFKDKGESLGGVGEIDSAVRGYIKARSPISGVESGRVVRK